MPCALGTIADPSRRPLIVALVALGLLLGLGVGPRTADANGATVPVVRNERAGPYELEVGILHGSPRVGTLHLSILVQDAQSGGLITDAVVTVRAEGPAGATGVGPLLTASSRDAPQFYDVDIPLDLKGDWTLFLDVRSTLGHEQLELPLRVTKAGGVSLAFLLTVGVALLAALFWASTLLRRRGRRRR